MLHARDPFLTLISDKFQVRSYVAEIIGGDYLIPMLWNGEDTEEIPFDELPQEFVIKANHGCGYIIIVTDKKALDLNKTKAQLNGWLGQNFGRDTCLGIEWGYKNIRPKLMIEEFIGENNKAPADYKFYCFSGRVEFFKIDLNRFDVHSERFFDRKLDRIDLYEEGLKLHTGPINLPNNLSDMISIAELLAKRFDFIRVDLYDIKGRIFFGELTPYAGGNSARFVPDQYDYVFGDKWKLTKDSSLDY